MEGIKKEKKVIEHEMCIFDFLYKLCPKHLSF
jgi:hypothetical protein